jgi:Fungal domain of unknown function (DUF1750)
MLHDRANWPTINLPAAQALQYPPHMLARQQQAAQMQMGASPSKVMQDRVQHRRGPSNAPEPTLEEEEDVSRGDMLDFMTPRDISRMRYEQHHEWMEEIMSSPFAAKQIVPIDLGLGRKGELEALTSGFFDAPMSVLQDTSGNTASVRVGRMELGKAEEFKAKVVRKVAEMEAELENLKKRHARRMAKFSKSSSVMAAEKKLRTVATDGRVRSTSEDGQGGKESLDDIVREVEQTIGKKIVPMSAVECVQRGGLEEKTPTPKTTTTSEAQQSEGVVGGERNGLIPGEQSAYPTVPTPNIPLQPTSMPPGTNAGQTSPPPPLSHEHQMQQPIGVTAQMDEPTVPSLDDMDVDMEMAGLGNENEPVERTAENEGNEWVMVDDVNAGTTAEQAPATSEAQTQPPQQAAASPATAPDSVFGNTPTGSGIQGLTPAEASGEGADEPQGMNEGDFDLGQGDFGGNQDDIGDGLVDFGDDHEDLDLEGMDDSAFGDAFHPPEESRANLEGQGDIL